LTSKRFSRWIIEIQHYDIQICHITGPNNYLAHVLSRNPAGLTENELQDLRQPCSAIVRGWSEKFSA
jgi:hypothetical protein